MDNGKKWGCWPSGVGEAVWEMDEAMREIERAKGAAWSCMKAEERAVLAAATAKSLRRLIEEWKRLRADLADNEPWMGKDGELHQDEAIEGLDERIAEAEKEAEDEDRKKEEAEASRDKAKAEEEEHLKNAEEHERKSQEARKRR